ncbi:MAG: hypothetical protein COT39_00680 [Parcubacteria group bacterium CG08_land_8_20_14_0_20_48_21]|nr:MAG: hypothetical protein AUK21_03685 [Parcubacteria group bacterium CG2_30_48_51]PIS33176.1 MAG: hypothetical protein COT39_00680 [Parcubacteria group bacterium CG08_land_8_20_14_0_20_48_21]PIW79419.1 MAG: hypothetical protein COZ99_01205 [Parcubacteria group bacterium CG_4_8_14_3_um_filter_48_16]PIY77680.1 MAG: hypothetical protein COY83_04030 [Parcubacteria group bacterium CG_4_10_14_0_8_um_filter_48_154]PIZ77456.1 MAG: hypothetical protein COY03_02890 [bacterium CG_4_10_14_0_2_um_filter_
MHTKNFSKIILFPKIQADTTVAAYLLKNFGGKMFPGIEKANFAFLTELPEGKTPHDFEQGGVIVLDLGGGRFDHHAYNERHEKKESVATLVALHLGIEDNVVFKKILAWAKRDDLDGKGTISDDPLDRAFGLSGIIMNLNRQYFAEPKKILEILFPILNVHVQEEMRRNIELPKTWDNLLQTGEAKVHVVRQGKRKIKIAQITSDDIALAGFVRAAKMIDLVVQRRSSGHINIITKQARKVNLRAFIYQIRVFEIRKQGNAILPSDDRLIAAGRIAEVPEWFYDIAANTIQNGGVNPGTIPPTRLTLDEVVSIVKETLAHTV